ncbi:YheU family protein [Pseudomonas asuensis]|jgi:uncharacterized protein YheU (UPF0270 family)|uniref:UPF0270 protein GCM10009425_17130 n=1 Tax=Pseudomonas asuensis TaxID=1825787 RepID=A0ABQ2GP86_9PSED|nr:YheU family protein [Pseudomonas asuensis]GGM06425.1 UPF0270 protein [Pseudomonas asuensis]
MLIPYDMLNPDTLGNLLEDFVTREGTDNGDETPLQTRVERARRALENGEAVIVFEPDSGQCQLMLRRDVPKEWLNTPDEQALPQ